MGESEASSRVIPAQTAALARELAPFDDLTAQRILAAQFRPLSEGTRRGYNNDWHRFVSWCVDMKIQHFPASDVTISGHLLHLEAEGLKYETMARVVTSIRAIHSRKGAPLERMQRVTNTLNDIARRIGRHRNKRAPMLSEYLRDLAKRWAEGDVRQKRDLAILLVGWSAALRRTELTGLRVEDLRFEPQGMMVHLDRRKGDQTGIGTDIAVPAQGGLACPVRAVREWMQVGGLTSGPLWRGVYGNRVVRMSKRGLSSGKINEVVQLAAAELGFDPKLFGAHSLRRGLMTSGARAGRRIEELMGTSGHKSLAVAQGYIDNAHPYESAASRGQLAGVTSDAPPSFDHLRTKAASLHARGFGVEQIRRILLKATGTDVPESMVQRWVER